MIVKRNNSTFDTDRVRKMGRDAFIKFHVKAKVLKDDKAAGALYDELIKMKEEPPAVESAKG